MSSDHKTPGSPSKQNKSMADSPFACGSKIAQQGGMPPQTSVGIYGGAMVLTMTFHEAKKKTTSRNDVIDVIVILQCHPDVLNMVARSFSVAFNGLQSTSKMSIGVSN